MQYRPYSRAMRIQRSVQPYLSRRLFAVQGTALAVNKHDVIEHQLSLMFARNRNRDAAVRQTGGQVAARSGHPAPAVDIAPCFDQFRGTYFEFVVNDSGNSSSMKVAVRLLHCIPSRLQMDTKVASLLRPLRNDYALLLAIPEDVKGTP